MAQLLVEYPQNSELEVRMLHVFITIVRALCSYPDFTAYAVPSGNAILSILIIPTKFPLLEEYTVEISGNWDQILLLQGFTFGT